MRDDLGSPSELQELADSIRDHGLIHPLSVDEKGNLIAGGRRFHVITTILKWDEIPVTLAEGCTNETKLRMMELEENLRRKEMNWKEKVRTIATVHRLHKRDAALNSEKWTQAATGELLGIASGKVEYCLTITEILQDPNHPIQKAESLNDAFKILLQLKQDEVAKYESSLMAELKSTSTGGFETKGATLSIDALVRGLETQSNGTSSPTLTNEQVANSQTTNPVTEKKTIRVDISNYLILGDSCGINGGVPALLEKFEAESVDHIITDLPYAIDMGMLSQSSTSLIDVSTVEEEHDVTSNQKLYELFFPLAFRVLKPNAFLVAWYDLDNKELIERLAVAAGFKFCRWPLHWIKTHTCKNQAAQYNPTKAVEHAIILRKGNATLANVFGANYWIGGNEDATRNFGHPFAKPEGLWRWIATAIAEKNSTILDPFNGSGSSTLALAKAGFYPRGIELKQDHYNKSVTKFKELMLTWFPDQDVNFV